MNRRTIFGGTLTLLLIAGIGSVAYKAGLNDGHASERASLTFAYENWALKLMHSYPQINFPSLTLVEDGAKIKVPSCQKPAQAFILLVRRPDGNNEPARANTPEGADFWVAKISPGVWHDKASAAALVGCRLPDSGEPTSIKRPAPPLLKQGGFTGKVGG